MEGACEAHVQESAGGATLTVTSCLLHEVLTKEELPHLLQYFCCQHNMTWLGAYESQGVRHSMPSCMARGDAQCCIQVARAAQP
jgi:hypothetical protein